MNKYKITQNNKSNFVFGETAWKALNNAIKFGIVNPNHKVKIVLCQNKNGKD